MVLHNINLVARPGQKIAFVGGTGAGKTTVANLINRFYTFFNICHGIPSKDDKGNIILQMCQ